MERIRNLMSDEESLLLYDARLKYKEDGNALDFWSVVSRYNHEWTISDELTPLIGKSLVIIYGAGKYGSYTKHALDAIGMKVCFFCDGDERKQGRTFEGIRIISPQEMLENYKDALVVISMQSDYVKVSKMLNSLGFDSENIYVPPGGFLKVYDKRQYFDVWEPNEEEFFVDGGAFDGNTTKEFFKWANGREKGALVIEPMSYMKVCIEECLKERENVKVCICAAWDKKEYLGSRGEGGGVEVGMLDSVSRNIEGVDIDSLMEDEKVTFIKLDVEGSELKALKGASKSIKRYRPRIAVCIYHKPDDILEIPEFLLSLVPTYKFWIRHYSTCMWETVLFAAES